MRLFTLQGRQTQWNPFQIAIKPFALVAVIFLFSTVPISAQANPSCYKIFQIVSKERHIIDTFRKGSTDFFLAQDLASKIKNMSEARQESWLQAIGNSYRQVPKKDPTPLAKWHIGGRRLLDRSLTLLENYDQKFEEAIQRGLTPRQAYGQFLNRQKKIFKTDYSEKEILQILEFLKADLKAIQAQRKGPEVKISLAGSFINGKAHIKNSDIDISVNDPRLVSEVPRWQQKINEIFAESGIPADLSIEAHSEPEAFYGKINPVVIRVSASKTEIMVFPPAISSGMRSELISAKPKIYLME